MTTNMNGYSQYKQQAINTMTQGEILVFLYEEIIKRLTKAKIFGEKGDLQVFHEEVVRVREIVSYFQQTLDHKYPISADLYRLYEYANYELSRALAGRKVEIIDEVMPFFVELRDTWKEADRISRMK